MSEKGRVVFCTPTVARPMQPFLDACEKAFPPVIEAGWKADSVFEVGNVYISCARATMLRKALDTVPDVIVFLDHDVSFSPEALMRLLDTEGDVVAGTYRYKTEDERYMDWLEVSDHAVLQRSDGALRATHVPAGFLKITRNAVNRFMEAYPQLVYGERCRPHVDLFNHGAIDGLWYGEDYAFSKRWREAGGTLWVIPDLDIAHHSAEADFPGNLWDFLKRKDFKVRALS